MNLHELADEYCDLKDMSDDPDQEMDDDEQERFKELSELNDELNDLLYYPARAISAIVVKDDKTDLERYGIDCAEGFHGFTSDHPLAQYVDYRSYAEDMLTDFTSVTWEDDDYYVEEI